MLGSVDVAKLAAIIIIFCRAEMSEAAYFKCIYSEKDLSNCTGALKYHCKENKDDHANGGCYIPVQCWEGEGFDFGAHPDGTSYPRCVPCKGNQTNTHPCWTNDPSCVCSPTHTCSDHGVVEVKPGNSTHHALCRCDRTRGFYHHDNPEYTCYSGDCLCIHKACQENEVLSTRGDCVVKPPNVTHTTPAPSTTTPLPSVSTADPDAKPNTTAVHPPESNTNKLVIPLATTLPVVVILLGIVLWWKCCRSRKKQAKSNGSISPPQGNGIKPSNGASIHCTTSEQADPLSAPSELNAFESPHHIVSEQEDSSNIPLLQNSPAPGEFPHHSARGLDIPSSSPPLQSPDGPPPTQEQSINSPGSEQTGAPRPVLINPAMVGGVNTGKIHHGNKIVIYNTYNYGQTTKSNRMPDETEENWSNDNISDDSSVSDSEDNVNTADAAENSMTRLGEIPLETMDTDSAGVSSLRPEPEGQSIDIGQHTEPKTVFSSTGYEGQQTEPKSVWSSGGGEGQQTEPKTVWLSACDEDQQTEPKAVFSSTGDERQITEPKVSFTHS